MNTHHPYVEAAWAAEMTLLKEGLALPCPDCGSSSDYGPKEAAGSDGTVRHYRACKMCGFWQEADGTLAYRCWTSQHVCVRHVGTTFHCPHCATVLQPAEPEGPAVHTCGKYLLPTDSGYLCTTCGHWYGRDSQVPWPLRGTD